MTQSLFGLQSGFEAFRGLAQIDWLSTWLTPLWVLSVGVFLGLAALAVLWCVLWLANRRLAASAWGAVQEGPLKPIMWLTVGVASFAILGLFVAQQPFEILKSLGRLYATGTQVYEFEVPPAPEDAEFSLTPTESEFQVSIRHDELRSLQFFSDQSLVVSGVPGASLTSGALVEVPAGVEGKLWLKGAESEKPFPEVRDQPVIDTLYVRNRSDSPAELRVFVETQPRHPEVASVPLGAMFVIAVFLLYLAQHAFMPRVSAVSLAAHKSEVAQPLFGILLILGVVFLAFSYFIPYFTMGEDIKMYKDIGFAVIMVFCLVQAVWGASTSVAEEIEGRTALTVLSKPLARWEFVLGKYLGIMWTVAVLFLALSLTFLTVLAYKPIYDKKEMAYRPNYEIGDMLEQNATEVPWQVAHYEVTQSTPGLLVTFLEAAILASISVAVSTRLPMLANFIICFAVYVLGHISPAIVQSSVANQQFEAVVFVARLIATVLPNFDHFNMQPAVATGQLIPWALLGGLLAYCLTYVLMSMLLALALFDDRDVG